AVQIDDPGLAPARVVLLSRRAASGGERADGLVLLQLQLFGQRNAVVAAAPSQGTGKKASHERRDEPPQAPEQSRSHHTPCPRRAAAAAFRLKSCRGPDRPPCRRAG